MKFRCKFGLLALLLLRSFDLFSQESRLDQDSIAWSREYRLKWSDFAGKADASTDMLAGCAASIYVKGFKDNGFPNFSVTNSFIKDLAWTKDTTSLMMLQHEQLHFDIAEVHARKIRKAVDSLRRNNVKSIDVYSKEIQKLLKMRDEADSLYDEQTSHGLKGKSQSEWRQKISEELESLKNYSSNTSPLK
jgi:hypothetical protein